MGDGGVTSACYVSQALAYSGALPAELDLDARGRADPVAQCT
jgi:hypothetical protein